MDDLAPAPTMRTSDNGGRAREENLASRKKAVKKVQPASLPKPEPDPAPESAADHQLDVLA